MLNRLEIINGIFTDDQYEKSAQKVKFWQVLFLLWPKLADLRTWTLLVFRVHQGFLVLETKYFLAVQGWDSNITYLSQLWEVSKGRRRARPMEKMLEAIPPRWSFEAALSWRNFCEDGDYPTCVGHTIATGCMWTLGLWLVGLRNDFLQKLINVLRAVLGSQQNWVKSRESSHIPLVPTSIQPSLPTTSIPYHSGTLVTIDELTCHYHPESIVCIGVNSYCCCTFYGEMRFNHI